MGTIAEIKNNIHRLVVETDDPEVLDKVQAYFLSLQQNSTLDWWDFISEKEKELIERGLVQLANGETVSHAVKSGKKCKHSSTKKSAADNEHRHLVVTGVRNVSRYVGLPPVGMAE